MIKILVPIDGSEHSDRIIAQLLKTIALYKESVELHVLNVQPPMPYGNKVSHAIGHEQLDKYLNEAGAEALKKPVAMLDAAKVAYQRHIVTGDPAEAILRLARDQGCSQIFMGTHGKSAVKGLLLGSVAAKVVQLSTIPVTLVRQ